MFVFDSCTYLDRSQAQQKEKQEEEKKDDEEEEEDENIIEMESKISRKSEKTKLSKKKVTLVELGPRLTMQLVKIEEKVMDGEVHYHKFSMPLFLSLFLSIFLANFISSKNPRRSGSIKNKEKEE